MQLHTFASMFVGSFALAAVASADPAPKGPDFVSTHVPPLGVDRSTVASSGTSPIDPSELVPFGFDSSRLDINELASVDHAAHWLAAHPGNRVILEGHTDRSGDSAYNDDLALRRAEAVGARLVGDGINSDRVIFVVYGQRDASPGVNANDRHVVVAATALSTNEVVRVARERNALSVTWRERSWQLQHPVAQQSAMR